MLCIKTVEKKHKQSGDNSREMSVFLAAYLSHVFPSLMAGVHQIFGV